MSQCDRVLQVLADGLPHDIDEIHRRAGTMRLNSRIAELRSRRGLDIVCTCKGGIYSYQLRDSLRPAEAPDPTGAGGTDSAGRSEDSNHRGSAIPQKPLSSLDCSEQLSMEIAA